MKFHEYAYGKTPPGSDELHVGLQKMEQNWLNARRPYYKAFPCVVDALSRVSLDIRQCDLQLGSRMFAIRFADGNEPKVGKGKLFSILTAATADSFLFMSQLMDEDGLICCQCRTHKLDKQVTLEEEIQWFTHNPSGKITHDAVETFHLFSIETMRVATRISLTCHLLADDPSIITPDVLSSDRERYNGETDEAWKQRAVDRARRRGVVGWNIGADYEVCPHYRRPHFGLRHTGKGKTIPRIVPIKGAVVHRNKLTEVPTGWMTPDGREIEPK